MSTPGLQKCQQGEVVFLFLFNDQIQRRWSVQLGSPGAFSLETQVVGVCQLLLGQVRATEGEEQGAFHS